VADSPEANEERTQKRIGPVPVRERDEEPVRSSFREGWAGVDGSGLHGFSGMAHGPLGHLA
jgi:hypothetical protein